LGGYWEVSDVSGTGGMPCCHAGELRRRDCLLGEARYSIALRGASTERIRRVGASVIGHEVEVTSAPRISSCGCRERRSGKGADQPMRILVTGGAGFVGSHYVRTLLDGGYPGFGHAQVTVLDKMTYAGNLANLEPVAASPRFSFVRGDICDAVLLASVVPGHDVVINFAAESHVDRSIADASAFVATNVTGVQVLLQACLDAGVSRVVQVSTDEVYGSIGSGSWAEGAPLEPNSPCSAAKAGGDLMARAYARTHGLNVSITRCSNNYGPYQYPEKVIPLFVTNLLDGLKVPLYGDGQNVRGWIHVDDHCRGIQLVLEKGQPGCIYHINGDAEISDMELTQALLEYCGAGWGVVEWVAERRGHDRRYSLDDSLLRGMGYTPRIPFSEGLKAAVRWYHDNRHWWKPLKQAQPGLVPGTASDAQPVAVVEGPAGSARRRRSTLLRR
jgi:dTDP-glucose 4,6-dehydratase